MTAALVLPVLCLVTAIAIELTFVSMEKSQLQQVADSAALAGARELAVTADGVTARAEAFAASQLADLTSATRVKADIVGERAGLKVGIQATRPSFFGNLLPPGGFKINAAATAMLLNTRQLCVLAHGESLTDAFVLRGRARLLAEDCLVHSNSGLLALGSSRIDAAAVQASGLAAGRIRAAPEVGAEVIEDPFLGRDLTAPGTCGATKTIAITADQTLPAGLHCDNLVVTGDAALRLAPGEHYFVGSKLVLKDRARLDGEDVVLVFERAAFEFLDRSNVSLSGRKSGPLAGFLIVGVKPHGGTWCGVVDPVLGTVDPILGGLLGQETLTQDICAMALGSVFTIASDNVQSLDGVVYVPASKLIVTGSSRVADASEWTVMIVRRLEIKGSPTLVINADYEGSSIPVPAAVQADAGARLAN